MPAFVMFSDAVLRDMLAHRPATEADVLAVSGVGEKKLARYGGAFRAVIAVHQDSAERVIKR